MAHAGAETASNSTGSQDMTLMESVNSLIGTLPRHAIGRENYYDLNGGEDVVPLEFRPPPSGQYLELKTFFCTNWHFLAQNGTFWYSTF